MGHYTSKASKRSKSEAIFDFSFLNRPASYKGKVRKTNSLVSSLLCSPQKNLILLFTSNISKTKYLKQGKDLLGISLRLWSIFS